MEAIYSSETSVDFQRTTRCYIPEDSTVQVRLGLPPASSGSERVRRFRGTYRLHLQGRRVTQASKVQLAACFCWFGETPTFWRNISPLLSGSKIKPKRKPAEAGSARRLLVSCLLILQPWRWKRYIPPKRPDVSELHGVTTQRTVLSKQFVFQPINRSEQRSNEAYPTVSSCECEGCGQAVCVFMMTVTDKSRLIGPARSRVRYNQTRYDSSDTTARTVCGRSITGIMGSNPTYVKKGKAIPVTGHEGSHIF
jgi:hypothetical protein